MNPPSPAPTYGLDNVDEDRELVRRMSAGDTQALAQFYERWSRPVHALVVQLVRDPDDADDVVEDAFYQAWRQASRYEPSRGAVSPAAQRGAAHARDGARRAGGGVVSGSGGGRRGSGAARARGGGAQGAAAGAA